MCSNPLMTPDEICKDYNDCYSTPPVKRKRTHEEVFDAELIKVQDASSGMNTLTDGASINGEMLIKLGTRVDLMRAQIDYH